jgi:hypothetical protein
MEHFRIRLGLVDAMAYRCVDRVLESWPRRVFIRLKPYPLTASETAIYRRPG